MSTSGTGPSGGAGPRRFLETYHALIAAVLTVVAAVLGIVAVYLGVSRSDVQQDVTVLEQDVTGLERQVDALEGQVETRDATIDALETSGQEQADQLAAKDAELEEKDARIVALEALIPDDTVVPDPGEPSVRHQGEVRLAEVGDAIDINAPADDELWGAKADTFASDSVYLNFGNLYFEDMDILRLGETATYELCSSSTGYGPEFQVDPASLESPNVCFRTASGRYATVQTVDASGDSVVLSITVWEKPL